MDTLSPSVTAHHWCESATPSDPVFDGDVPSAALSDDSQAELNSLAEEMAEAFGWDVPLTDDELEAEYQRVTAAPVVCRVWISERGYRRVCTVILPDDIRADFTYAWLPSAERYIEGLIVDAHRAASVWVGNTPPVRKAFVEFTPAQLDTIRTAARHYAFQERKPWPELPTLKPLTCEVRTLSDGAWGPAGPNRAA